MQSPTLFLETRLETYAYRRMGKGAAPPLVLLQHFTGTLDNWDPALLDLLARDREIILFESAGIGRSTGEVPTTVGGMTEHLLAFLETLGLNEVDLLGFSLGGMVAQLAVLKRPSLVRKLILVGTAPSGGTDIMHLEKPQLRRILEDQALTGLQRLEQLFFTGSPSGQRAARAFTTRLQQRTSDREPVSGPHIAQAQVAAFRNWERVEGERYAALAGITQPCLVVNGVFDQMIPVENSYALAEHIPKAVLVTYPDAGHGSLFQYPQSFVQLATLFLDGALP